jgi:gluconolactonase
MGMKTMVYLILAAALAATMAGASEVPVVSNVLGPEGPLVVDGDLYYVAWISNTLSRWDGKTSTVLNITPGCETNGLAITQRNTFLVACDDIKGAILELDRTGKQIRRWDADRQGRKFDGGINDIVVAANGAAYATLSGPYVDPPAAVMGKIFYLAPQAREWVEVAGDLNFANGIGISPDQKTLYVSETVANSIKKFTINADGTLSNRWNFAQLNVLVKNKIESRQIGPDSMKIDRHGNIYVAQWLGGKVLKISPQGDLLHVFTIAAGDGTTNVALDLGEKNLYVTTVKNPDDPRFPGSILKVPNVD